MDKRSFNNAIILSVAQAVLGSQMPIYIILGGLVGQSLTKNVCFSTLPISLLIIGSMVSAPILSRLMHVNGRKTGLIIGNAGGLAGSIISLLAIYIHSFDLFLLGSFICGCYMSSQGFYRFAAADTCEQKFKARAISFVLTGGLVAAIVGPSIVKISLLLDNPVPFFYPYMAVVILNLSGPALFSLLEIPNPQKPKNKIIVATSNQAANRTLLTMLKTPMITVSILCGMITYGLMNLVMTATPMAMVGCGYIAGDAASVVSAHALAMYIPSFFTGRLIEKFGEKTIITTGMVILISAVLLAIDGTDLFNFYFSLILVGFGWNFGFIGSTSLLTKCHSISERGKIQGINDFCVFGFVALASLTSGWLMNCSSNSPELGWKLINLTATPFIAIAVFCILFLSLFNNSVKQQ